MVALPVFSNLPSDQHIHLSWNDRHMKHDPVQCLFKERQHGPGSWIGVGGKRCLYPG